MIHIRNTVITACDSSCFVSFVTLTLLVGRQEGHPALDQNILWCCCHWFHRLCSLCYSVFI